MIKHKYHLTTFFALFFMMFLCGCSNSTVVDQDAYINFSNIDRVSFISFQDQDASKTTFSHKFSNDLNDLYRHYDYYEATYRAYKNVMVSEAQYDIQMSEMSVDDLTAKAKEHYICVDLLNDEEFPYADARYKTLIFNVESGDFWVGADCEHLSLYGHCENDEYHADTDLLEYVEGKWLFPEYHTVYEYILSGDWT